MNLTRTAHVLSGQMRRLAFLLPFAVAAVTVASAGARQPRTPAPTPAAEPPIHIEDVERFYRVFDAAGGAPTAAQLERDYLAPGTAGLHSFAKARNVTATRIAESIVSQPELYTDARRCLAVLPRVRTRLRDVLRRLRELYPEARPAPIAIVVGRGRPVAIGDPEGGVRIGLEALCAANQMHPDPEARFVHVIAHEYAHVQQSAFLNDESTPTVLQAALAEGGAELVAELISGDVAAPALRLATRGREREIETRFAAERHGTTLSTWFYNHPGTPEWPADLGYWVGYRIASAAYARATDKRGALAALLGITDPEAYLAASGWRPGLPLP